VRERKLIRRTRTRDARHRPRGTDREGLRVCGPEGGSTRAISISHIACLAWPGLVRSVPAVSPPFVMKSVAGSCGVLDVHCLLYYSPSYRICPSPYTVWTTSVSFSFFLFSFSPVWRTLQRPSNLRVSFFVSRLRTRER
jgi:hypothetical protein